MSRLWSVPRGIEILEFLEPERVDPDMGGEGAEWCRSEGIHPGCSPEQSGQHIVKEREGCTGTSNPDS